MKKLLVYLKDYKKESVLGPLFKLLEASFELFVPLVMASIIDVGIENKDKTHVIYMGLVLFALGVIGLVCSLTAQYFAAKAAVGFTAKLKSVLFAHIMKFSYSQMDEMGSSSLITRMTSDMNQVQSGVNLILRLFLRSPFIVFGAMIMAFTVDVKSAVIFVVVIPLLSIVVFGLMLIGIKIYHRLQSRLEVITRNTRESLQGVRVIRAFRLEDEYADEFMENNRALKKIQLLSGRVSSIMNPLTYVIINVGLIALIWSGALRVNSGNISQGAVVALVNYMSQILVELIKLANLILSATKAYACGNRIQAVLEMKPEDEVTPQEDKNKENVAEEFIAFNDVSFSYDGAQEETLSNISFKVNKGETIGIIGGTGSGKSTLINLLSGFYKPTNGQIILDGKDISSMSAKQILDVIKLVPQKAVLFTGTVAENIRWGNKDASDEDVLKALETAQAAEFVLKKEGGINCAVSQGGKNFSGGQRQRLTIARALVAKSAVLILDDSTSALDYKTDAMLRKEIAALSHRPTVFLISQRTNSLQNADKILVMDDGMLVGQGTHEELLVTCDVYREIHESQYKKGGNQ